jgi:hypothetical protein
MRKRLFLLILTLLTAVPAYSAGTGSLAMFRNYMHEIYKSYRNALLSAQAMDYGMAQIHLRHLQDYIREVPRHIPDATETGVKLDKAALLKRIGDFEKKISNVKKAADMVDISAVEQLRGDVVTICVDCHKESKLPFLFRLTERKTIFVEYMHGVWDNFRMGRVYFEKGETFKAEESLKIVNHYLTLLKDTYPEKGPSGVVMDRSWLNDAIKRTQRVNELVQLDLHEKQTGDFAILKNELNDICVACHEPERIK